MSAVFVLIRNHSANNQESLFARIGFFDIINSSGESSKETSKAFPI